MEDVRKHKELDLESTSERFQTCVKAQPTKTAILLYSLAAKTYIVGEKEKAMVE